MYVYILLLQVALYELFYHIKKKSCLMNQNKPNATIPMLLAIREYSQLNDK